MGLLKKAQVVNAIETRLALGYTNSEFIGEKILPRLVVSKRNGTYLTFGKEALRTYDSSRGLGSKVKRLNFEHSTAEYNMGKTHMLEAPVDDEEDEQTEGVSQLSLLTQNRLILQESLALEREIEIKNLVATVGNYGSLHGAVATAWTTYSTAKPRIDIKNANELIRAATGAYADCLVVSAKTFNSLVYNEDLMGIYKYTQAGLLTAELIAAACGVKEIIVGLDVYSNNGTMTDIWGTSFAALIRRGKPSTGGVVDPSRVGMGFGYTLQHVKYPKVKQYRDETVNSDIVRVEELWKVIQTSSECGYFFEGTLA